MREKLFELKDFYSIEVDKEKNQLIFSVFGIWKTPDQIPEYLNHVNESLKLLKPGFGCCSVIDDDKPPSLAAGKLQQECMKSVMNAGVGKISVFLPKRKGSMLQKLSLSVYKKLTRFKEFRIFDDKEKAFEYLDEG